MKQNYKKKLNKIIKIISPSVRTSVEKKIYTMNWFLNNSLHGV